LALFSRRRLVGWLSEEQVAVFGRVKRGYPEGVVSMLTDLVPGRLLSLHVTSGSKKYWITSEGDNLTLHLQETVGGELVEAAGVTITSPTELGRLERALEKKEEENIRDVLRTMQELRADAFGFGELLRRKDPGNPALADADTWREAYARAKVDVKVRVRARNRGFTK
jgi:spore germination protein KC